MVVFVELYKHASKRLLLASRMDPCVLAC
jgi:hypothetical protein